MFNCIDIDQHSGLLAKGKACGRIKRLIRVENYRWSRGTDRLISLAKYFKSVGITEIRFDIVGDMSISKHVANFYVPKNEGSLLKLVTYALTMVFRTILCSMVILNPERVIANSDVEFNEKSWPVGAFSD